MGAEIIAITSGLDYETNNSEHGLSVLIVGDIETVRKQLVKALEKLDYQVTDEQPLTARRNASNEAKNYTSTNILDYPIKLTVGLKTIDDNTKASFNYEIKYPWVGKAEKHLILLEVKSICALANQGDATNTCLSCGTLATTDSRFCRRCGTLLALPEPAELEVLVLTAKVKNAYDYLMFGTICLVIALICLLIVTFVPVASPKLLKLFKVLKVFGVIASGGIIFDLFWTYKLRELIRGKVSIKQNKKLPVKEVIMLPVKRTLEPTYRLDPKNNKIGRTTGELVYRQPPPSVTEHTTDLLPAERTNISNNY
ncbi:MAG: hypothetical protein IPK14_00035 [Blastocatellia bacterium]|nr:hypothetical protein [Blastocatellia bacterium]